jgi:hypothetical protein
MGSLLGHFVSLNGIVRPLKRLQSKLLNIGLTRGIVNDRIVISVVGLGLDSSQWLRNTSNRCYELAPACPSMLSCTRDIPNLHCVDLLQ